MCYVPLLVKVSAPAVVRIWTLNIEQPDYCSWNFFFLTGFAFMFFLSLLIIAYCQQNVEAAQ